MNIDAVIASRQDEIKRKALEAIARIEKLLPNLKKCIEAGGFPVWLDDISGDVRLLSYLAVQSAMLFSLRPSRRKMKR